ncbi:MAG: hypothetical protein AAF808_23590 [Cyanobacteria bacterium P01_D01_bin.2]
MDSWIDGDIDFEELRSQLFDAYQHQSPLHKSIVQLFSISYGPTSITNAVAALNYIGITTRTGKKLTPGNLKPQITNLIEDQLLIYGSGHLPQCHPLIVEIITRHTVDRGPGELRGIVRPWFDRCVGLD